MLLLKILIGVIVLGCFAMGFLGCIGLFMSYMSNLKNGKPEDEIDTIEIIIEKVNKDDTKEDS